MTTMEESCIDIEHSSPARPNKISLQVLACPAQPLDSSVTTPLDSSERGDNNKDYDDWSQSTEDSELDLVPERCCRLCKRSRACFVVLYLWLALFVAGCFVAMVLVGVLVAEPFRKAQRFVQTTCSPVGHTYGVSHTCSCGKACNSGFPCLSVTGFICSHIHILLVSVNY